ncbi:hypothetical protein BD311DRAFT_652316, partial [Dichomitus squalens]
TTAASWLSGANVSLISFSLSLALSSFSSSPLLSLPACLRCSREFTPLLHPDMTSIKTIFNWLNREHTPMKLSTHRKFVFTLWGDIYLRYNSLVIPDGLEK